MKVFSARVFQNLQPLTFNLEPTNDMNVPPPTEKQARLFWAALTGLAIAIIVALLVALVWGLGRVLNVFAPVIWPLAVAGVLACLLDPVVDLSEGFI